MCHIALACAALLVAPGCAARAGWSRSEARTCGPAGPARLCVAGAPDRALVVRAGGAALVPGECALSPRRRGGLLRVTAEDGRTGTSRARWLRVRQGATTRVTATAAGKPVAAAPERCTGQVETDMSEQ